MVLKVQAYDVDSATESQLIDTFRVVYSTDAASPDRDSASSMTQGVEGDRPTATPRYGCSTVTGRRGNVQLLLVDASS